MRVLITGSSGQIGTNLALRLLQEGVKVFGVDRRPNSWTDKFPYALQDLSARFVNFQGGIGGVSYPSDIRLVVHLAANAKVHQLVEEPWRAFDNIALTFNVLEFCRQSRVPIILASSREVYGDVHRYLTDESQTHLDYTESTYSASKIAGEALVYAYAKCYNLFYLVFRFSNVYGRYDNDLERMERVIPLFIKKISRGEPVTIFGKEKILDFTYVDDCVQGLRLGIEKLLSGAVRNETINLAYGEGHTILEAAQHIAEELGRRPEFLVAPARVGEVTHYVADISKARRLLGYQPLVDLREGIRRAIAWSRAWPDQGVSGVLPDSRTSQETSASPSAAAPKRKILFLSAFFRPFRGGAEVFVEEVGKRLARIHEVTVLTARLSRALPVTETLDGVRVLRLGWGSRLDKFLYPLLALGKSLAVPHDIAYGVLESYAGLALAFYKRFTRRPAILNLQSGTLDDWRRGWGFNLLLRRLIHRSPDVVHAISRHLAARARWFGARDVVVIPNGVSIRQFSLAIPRDPRKIVSLGRLYPVKGIQYLLEAMPEVLRDFPEVRLEVIGDGPDRSRLEELARKLGVAHAVVFRGGLPHEEIARELAGALIFVGPSLREGQGIAFVEAQAAGAAVVGTAVGGIPEVVADGWNGLLVAPRDPRALAQAVVRLLGDHSLRKTLVENARKNILGYDWDVIARSVERLVDRVISSAHRNA